MGLAGCTGSPFLQPEDLQPLVRAVLENHSQLELFCRDPSSRDLHSLYITFVLSSIFFRAGGSAWRTRRLALHQFRRLGLLDTLDKLWQGELDLNLIDHFSYDQFYVFFVKFMEVCEVDKASSGCCQLELLQWAFEEGDQYSHFLVKRIWQVPGAVDRSGSMQFWHWVGFLLAEVDKCSVSSLEYWFPVLDIDGDGLLSLDELHQFYRESINLLRSNNIGDDTSVSWDDIVTQLIDTLESWPCSLAALRARHSNYLAHILDAFINIFRFNLDESGQSCKQQGTLSPVQRYVVGKLLEM